jgi:hypothetical protein
MAVRAAMSLQAARSPRRLRPSLAFRSRPVAAGEHLGELAQLDAAALEAAHAQVEERSDCSRRTRVSSQASVWVRPSGRRRLQGGADAGQVAAA